jgi:hypothetical protein
LPTPTITDPARVVVSVAVGAPEAALFDAVAPIAPDPFVPVVSTPLKAITVNEDETARDSVAVTIMFVSAFGANARQISEVPD